MTAAIATSIAAIATAPGRGGIGVVRVSGPHARLVMQALCGRLLTPRQASHLPFLDAQGHAIDHGIALWFPAPHSYTGEDVLELQGHGGPVVMRRLLARCLEAGRETGLRLAEPGEFTRRAFLSGKMDLAQAEAVADLIEASTEAAARAAARSLEGAFSQAVHALVERVIRLRMLVEATLDFPEENIDFLEAADARGQLAGIRAQLDDSLAQARQGALLREGLHVVLAGQPNVGKSSLLNALAGAELAIVTPIAGTTRDKIQQTIQIESIPIHLIDTAGLRDTDDTIERLGIERAWNAIARADVALHLLDATTYQAGHLCAADAAIDARIAQHVRAGTPTLRVINKIDLTRAPEPRRVQAQPTEIWLSARDGAGIEHLRAALLEIAGWQGEGSGLYLARERHLSALRAAREHLAIAAEHADDSAQSLDVFAEELRLAQETLNRITGAFSSDDLLGEIFSRFCIGK